MTVFSYIHTVIDVFINSTDVCMTIRTWQKYWYRIENIPITDTVFIHCQYLYFYFVLSKNMSDCSEKNVSLLKFNEGVIVKRIELIFSSDIIFSKPM